jgi:hypothetical protein
MKWTRGGNAQAELALLASRGTARRFKCAVDPRQNGERIVEKSAAGVGQFDAARLAAK